ncbi:hypothetical protein AAVH_17200 [Aphelenchoides avenae]|nr:hypothetical protein AAVH_17200 [Aphelenchus avenae]
MLDSFRHFGNILALSDLLKCVHAIRDESEKAPRKEEANMGYFEVDEIMVMAEYTWMWAMMQKTEIPAKCAALYDKSSR